MLVGTPVPTRYSRRWEAGGKSARTEEERFWITTFRELKLMMLDDLLFPSATPGAGRLTESPRKGGIAIFDNHLPESCLMLDDLLIPPATPGRRWKAGGKSTQTGVSNSGPPLSSKYNWYCQIICCSHPPLQASERLRKAHANGDSDSGPPHSGTWN